MNYKQNKIMQKTIKNKLKKIKDNALKIQKYNRNQNNICIIVTHVL